MYLEIAGCAVAAALQLLQPQVCFFVAAVVPPGYFTSAGVTRPCPDGSFRPDWKSAAAAGSCTACGEGVLGLKTDRVVRYYPNGTIEEVPVQTSTSDCCECLPFSLPPDLLLKAVQTAWEAASTPVQPGSVIIDGFSAQAARQQFTRVLCAVLLTDIQTGQGLYYETLTKTWRAKDCVSDGYGVTNTTFGLTPTPCR